MAQCTEMEVISQKLQQGMIDWNPSPLVPKSFQSPVASEALNEAVARIAALARAPLEEAIERQQAQIELLQTRVEKLEMILQK